MKLKQEKQKWGIPLLFYASFRSDFYTNHILCDLNRKYRNKMIEVVEVVANSASSLLLV